MSGLPIQMAEYNTMDALGQPVDLSKRKTTFTANGTTVTSKAVLTEAEAATYTLRNVLSGDDQWDADNEGRILAAPTMVVGADRLTWSDLTGLAACYLLTIDGRATLTTDESVGYTAGSKVSVQSVSVSGILGRAITPETAVGISQPTANSQQPTASIYDLNGRLLAQPQKGINIQKGRKYMGK